jgi:flagellar protein FlbD
MILVSRLNGSQIYINAELIQSIEATPDTVITLTNNVKLVVREKAEKVVERMIEYQRTVRSPQPLEDRQHSKPGE